MEKYMGKEEGFSLVPSYFAFKPIENMETPKGWKSVKDKQEYLHPDKRTKEGKELSIKLLNLPILLYMQVYDILGLPDNRSGRFIVPNIYISEDKTEVYLKIDSDFELSEIDYEEVTLTYVNKKL